MEEESPCYGCYASTKGGSEFWPAISIPNSASSRMSAQLCFPARYNNCRLTSKNRILARLSRSFIAFDVSVLNIHRALDLMKGQMEHCPSDFNVKRSIPPRKRLVYADIMSTIVANIAELQGLAGSLARTEPELSTPAALPLPNQGWPKMRKSSNSLTKGLARNTRTSQSRPVTKTSDPSWRARNLQGPVTKKTKPR